MSNTFWGYPINVPATIKEVMRRDPTYRENVRSLSDFDRWGTSMFSYARETFGRECGIQDLSIQEAWIGHGRKGDCWALPPTMNPSCRSPKDTQHLSVFLKIVGYTTEPKKYYSTKAYEPSHLRKAPPIPKVVEDTLWEACCQRFESGTILEELLAEEKAKENGAKLEESLVEDMAKVQLCQ